MPIENRDALSIMIIVCLSTVFVISGIIFYKRNRSISFIQIFSNVWWFFEWKNWSKIRRVRAHRIFKTASKLPMRTHGSTASDYNNRNVCDRPNTGNIGESLTMLLFSGPHYLYLWHLDRVYKLLYISVSGMQSCNTVISAEVTRPDDFQPITEQIKSGWCISMK